MNASRVLRPVCPPDRVPPGSWEPGATVSFRGAWWFVEELFADTQTNTGTHFTLIEVAPKPRVIVSVDRTEDPGWEEGEVVTTPTGTQVMVTGSTLTTGRITYLGVDVPPADTAELTALFDS